MKLKSSIFIAAVLILIQSTNSIAAMKNRKGKVIGSKEDLQLMQTRDNYKYQQKMLNNQNSEISNDSRAVNQPSEEEAYQNQIKNGLCYTVCQGNKISHPCGIAPKCQSNNFVRGCTNPKSKNYNPAAKADDGSCVLSNDLVLESNIKAEIGCKNDKALNYSPNATMHNEALCTFAQATCATECNGRLVKHACGQPLKCVTTVQDPAAVQVSGEAVKAGDF